MFKKLSLYFALGLIVTTIACKGPEGPAGPQGGKGDTGVAGAAGATGPAGANGLNGAGSTPFSLSSGADTTRSDGGYTTGLSDLTADNIAMLEKSAVFVYVKSGGVYWPLPGFVGFGEEFSNFSFVFGVDEDTFFVDLFQTNWSEDQDNAPKRKMEDVRVVIMPTKELARQNLDIDFKNYNEVVEKLGLNSQNTLITKRLTSRSK